MKIVPEGTLAYGMQLPIQSQSELYVADWERTAGPDELVAIARKADDTGFLYVAVCDHVAIPEDLAPRMGTAWYDTIATLGFLAAETDHVRLLSHVWVPGYRHWRVSVKSFSTLDHLSKGRIVVGVGAGHVAGEFEELGVDFEGRGRLLDESIDKMSEGFANEFVDGLGSKPRPVQSPRPPIWVGGSSRAAQRRAAERGDGWLPQGTPKDQMPDAIAFIREKRAEAGREDGLDIGTINLEFINLAKQTPDQVAESLLSWREMGVDQVQIRFQVSSCDELLDQMDRFGAEVAPHLGAA